MPKNGQILWFLCQISTSSKIYDFYAKIFIGVNLKEYSERKTNAIMAVMTNVLL